MKEHHYFMTPFSTSASPPFPHPKSVSVDECRHHDIKVLFLAELLIEMLIFLSVNVDPPLFYRPGIIYILVTLRVFDDFKLKMGVLQ
jgi:hypothetical protein